MKHFLNQEMLAPNVLTVPVDANVVQELEAFCRSTGEQAGLSVFRPAWSSDIRWIGAETEDAFAAFQSVFDRLDVSRHVREYVDLDRDVRLYAGFLHTRSRCTDTDFHVDWMLTNNEAFTLLTPLPNGSESTLLYKRIDGEITGYAYRPGEAIIFGDHFTHSTPIGVWDPPFTMLVLNFGTDKVQHWDKIKRTVGRQCNLLQRPDGSFERPQQPEGSVDTKV